MSLSLTPLKRMMNNDDGAQADRRQFCSDVLYPVGSHILDPPAGSAQGDVVEKDFLLLWLLPGNLELLGNWRARKPLLFCIGVANKVYVGARIIQEMQALPCPSTMTSWMGSSVILELLTSSICSLLGAR